MIVVHNDIFMFFIQLTLATNAFKTAPKRALEKQQKKLVI